MLTPSDLISRMAIALSATPLTFGYLQATTPTLPELAPWKPVFDTGVIGCVAMASFWLVKYLLEQLKVQSATHEARMNALAASHKDDMRAMMDSYRQQVVMLDATMRQTLEQRGEDRVILQQLAGKAVCVYDQEVVEPPRKRGGH